MRPVPEYRFGNFEASATLAEILHGMRLIFDGSPIARAPNRLISIALAGFSTWSLASACTRYWATRQKLCR